MKATLSGCVLVLTARCAMRGWSAECCTDEAGGRVALEASLTQPTLWGDACVFPRLSFVALFRPLAFPSFAAL